MFSTVPKVLKDTKEFQNAHVIPTGGKGGKGACGSFNNMPIRTSCMRKTFALVPESASNYLNF